jgi:hypothetical protein
MATINEVPNELLTEILIFIGNRNEITRTIGRISRRFNSLVCLDEILDQRLCANGQCKYIKNVSDKHFIYYVSQKRTNKSVHQIMTSSISLIPNIIDFLNHTNNIHSLFLDNVTIGTQQMYFICKILRKNTKIHTLRFCNNNFVIFHKVWFFLLLYLQ